MYVCVCVCVCRRVCRKREDIDICMHIEVS